LERRPRSELEGVGDGDRVRRRFDRFSLSFLSFLLLLDFDFFLRLPSSDEASEGEGLGVLERLRLLSFLPFFSRFTSASESLSLSSDDSTRTVCGGDGAHTVIFDSSLNLRRASK
jgi:hypothetical protein